MEIKTPSVLEQLKKQRDFYRQQIKDIEVAIAALQPKGNGQQADSPPAQEHATRKRIPWKKLVIDLIEPMNHFSIETVQDMLAAKGYPEAKTTSGRNSINTTLARLVENKELERVGVGEYQKVEEKKETTLFD